MTAAIEEPDKKEILLKIDKTKSGMQYKGKTYNYYRISAIPRKIINNENYHKGYFEITENEMKLTVFEHASMIYSLERRRKINDVVSEENFRLRREVKDWKERFENVQKNSLALTAKIVVENHKMKDLGIDYRIDPLDI